MLWCAYLGFAACQQVGSGPANDIFENVGQQGGEEDGDDQAEESDVRFVSRRLLDDDVGDHEEEWEGAGVEEEPGWRDDVVRDIV
jgi:hypothetical protein